MNDTDKTTRLLSSGDLHQLKRWNTPTIYNGWEQITKRDASAEGFNIEEVTDYMPQMGPMIGYAVTLVIEPSNKEHRSITENKEAYRKYIASVPGPKIVVVQDLDKPRVVGANWGEINAMLHRGLGCVGTLTDGAIRDVDEMTDVGFKALARRLCVGHAFAYPVRWGCDVEVFGTKVSPGDLIHADKHGFVAIPPEEQPGLLDAARFMDTNECVTMIAALQASVDCNAAEVLASMERSGAQAAKNVRAKFSQDGES